MTKPIPGNISEFRPEKLSRQVLRDLTRQIVNGRVDVQNTPTEQDICKRYGISKTVAREVISQVEAMGLIVVRHGRRMEVRDRVEWDFLDPILVDSIEDRGEINQLLRELHDLRTILEPAAAARAAARSVPNQVRELRQLLEAMESAIDDPDRYLGLDVEFHAAVFASVGNRLMTRILESVAALQRVSRRATNLLPGALPRATADHRAICEAVAAGDSVAARVAMDAHLGWLPAAWKDDDR